jgi:hypothetical protein
LDKVDYHLDSVDFAEKCRKALEASFGEIPLPKSLIKKKK